jgi:hypothetical protein
LRSSPKFNKGRNLNDHHRPRNLITDSVHEVNNEALQHPRVRHFRCFADDCYRFLSLVAAAFH